MRKADQGARLTAEQESVAQSGLKAMIPIGRPFLDYVLSALADAGYRRVCLVIGPEHNAVRDYYAKLPMSRIQVEFAVQEKPLGTADAVAAAESFAAGEHVAVMNSDNFYPTQALSALRELGSAGLAAFERDALVAGGNIPAQRVAKFAVTLADDKGCLRKVLEKPDQATLDSLVEPLYVSMNCWRLGPATFEACKHIKPSPRGEYELTDAVQYAIDVLGETFRIAPIKAAVLDLSSREDIEAVAQFVKGMEVRL